MAYDPVFEVVLVTIGWFLAFNGRYFIIRRRFLVLMKFFIVWWVHMKAHEYMAQVLERGFVIVSVAGRGRNDQAEGRKKAVQVGVVVLFASERKSVCQEKPL